MVEGKISLWYISECVVPTKYSYIFIIVLILFCCSNGLSAYSFFESLYMFIFALIINHLFRFVILVCICVFCSGMIGQALALCLKDVLR